jgi:hypothetical protein
MVWRRICLLFAVLFAAACASAAAPVVPGRIVAIGDLHGDYEAWRAIVQAAGLVDAQGQWTGARTILVQTGDVPDRGPDSLKIIEDLMRLQREARRAGGQVIALVGNHEAMNVIGDLRYVHPGEYAVFADAKSEQRRTSFYQANRSVIERVYLQSNPNLTSDEIRMAWLKSTPLGQLEHQAAWGRKGPIGRWIRDNPAVALIGGNLFVHGGISADYAKLSVDEINRRVAGALAAQEMTIESIINDPRGPLWYRGLVTREARDAEAKPEASAPAKPQLPIEEELDLVLRSHRAQRIVVGHTPSLLGIQMPYGGRLIRIDTGISRHYGGKLSYLEILNGKPVPHLVERPRAAGGK